ncbi:ABC-type multidrug transport system permease subunit [Salirhabdus euzebyi]|uniref:ABC-type multidrug transport system permease subunit n=1 Tax=Salirhabdus euzebyi TaxID=394506 RepID=A0A841Q2F2_9BACI|nr:DUF1189 family protein [Salirhabdus euzebyi]MBB6452485.1 ABC-type multidrug transport system permease subunit [Salirhabdus euzebyi]
MGLLIALKNSLLLPKKEALFRLNRVGMLHTMTYLFVLMIVLFIPNLVNNIENLSRNEEKSMYMLQVIVFYPFVIFFTMICLVSILTFLSFIISKLVKRKLTYQLLWKMTTFAITIPLLIHSIVSVIGYNNPGIIALLLLILYTLMYKMIIIYPKKP